MTTRTNTTALILFAIIMFLVPLAFAQQDTTKRNKEDKIEQLRIAYITQELDLTTDEAETFWPVYNEGEKAMREERKKKNKSVNYLKKNRDSMTEADIEKKMKEALDSDIELAELKKKYTEKVADVIGYTKALKLLETEKKFKKELLKRVNQPKQPRQNRPPGGNQNRPPRPLGRNQR